MNKRFLIGLLALVCWLGVAVGSGAQGTDLRLESRVDRLESELSRVRLQLNQLEARSGSNRPTPAMPTGTPARPDELSLDDQLDNLATLAIELKQDLRQLATRVTQLEQSSAPR